MLHDSMLYMTARYCYQLSQVSKKKKGSTLFKKLIDFQQRQKEKYRLVVWLIFVCVLTGDWTHNLGVWGWTNWAPRPGPGTFHYRFFSGINTRQSTRHKGKKRSTQIPGFVWLTPSSFSAAKVTGTTSAFSSSLPSVPTSFTTMLTFTFWAALGVAAGLACFQKRCFKASSSKHKCPPVCQFAMLKLFPLWFQLEIIS